MHEESNHDADARERLERAKEEWVQDALALLKRQADWVSELSRTTDEASVVVQCAVAGEECQDALKRFDELDTKVIRLTPRQGVYLVRRTSGAMPCDSAFACDTMSVTVQDGVVWRGWIRGWAVEVDDIMEFVDRHGECVVGRDKRGFATIEIYDEYRE